MSVTLETTLGDLKFELFLQEAPKTCENFLARCAAGHYNNTKFHRLIRGFLVQGGQISNDDDIKGIMGYNIDKEIADDLRFSGRGFLGMSGASDVTDVGDRHDRAAFDKFNHGSQFFVTLATTPALNGKNTVFGKLLWGHDTLDSIEGCAVDGEAPKEDVLIRQVKIHANPLASAS